MNKIVVSGLPGVGKTTICEKISELYQIKHIDIDKQIENRCSRSITNLIREEGELYFRKVESEVLKKALDDDSLIISVGGGALVDEENFELASKKSTIVQIKSDIDILTQRIIADEKLVEEIKRPLLVSSKDDSSNKIRNEIIKCWNKRKEFYNKANVSVWNSYATLNFVVETIYKNLIQNKCVDKTTYVPIETSENSWMSSSQAVKCKTVIVITKSNITSETNKNDPVIIDENYSSIEKGLVSNFKESKYIYKLKSGESYKSISELEKASIWLSESGITRENKLIAVGGGVVGDLAGFLASTYMRGIELEHYPTTLVAQVDSAIGGKTAVNTAKGKNLVGTIYPGSKVNCVVDALNTLPVREYNSGIAEVIKYGIIYSEEFLKYIDENAEKLIARDKNTQFEIVEFCVTAKAKVVQQDICDVKGIRAVLNFGHTVGHAIEKMCGYGKLLHGEAVSIGMIEAMFISSIVNNIDTKLIKKIALLLKKFNLPLEIPKEIVSGNKEYLKDSKLEEKEDLKNSKKPIDKESIFYNNWYLALTADKKRSAEKVNFITLKEIGNTEVKKIDFETVINCVAWDKAELIN